MLTYAKLSPAIKALISKPKNEKALAGYSMEVSQSMEHSRGVSWTGVIKLNGAVIADVENHGDGGCNVYKPIIKDEYDKLIKLAEQTYPNNYEKLDALVGYLDVITNC
jgi:hypothetical protein